MSSTARYASWCADRDLIDVVIGEIADKFNELKLNLAGLRERLSVEFNVNVNDIINEELDPKWNKEEINDDHLKIKKRIEAFGENQPYGGRGIQ
jgi:chromosome segregation protein